MYLNTNQCEISLSINSRLMIEKHYYLGQQQNNFIL
jgi:hypothetical protein